MKSGSQVSNNRRGKKTSTVVFPIAPDPFEDESPISWVQRLCGEHHCTYATLEKLLQLKPKFYDWDDSVDSRLWLHLSRCCGFREVPCSVGRQRNLMAANFLGKDKWQMLIRKTPSYKWCALCWQEDSIPYLRWFWRWDRVKICSLHRVPLSDACPWCNSSLLLTRALLTKSGPYVAVPNLSYCGSCSMPMADLSINAEAVGVRSERDFCWESWSFLQKQVDDIYSRIHQIETHVKEKSRKSVFNDDLELLYMRLNKTRNAAHVFLDKFLSATEVHL
jgi:hypothetical protein